MALRGIISSLPRLSTLPVLLAASAAAKANSRVDREELVVQKKKIGFYILQGLEE